METAKKIIKNIDGTRFGNHLYFFLQCSINPSTQVKYLDNMSTWLEYFPKLSGLVTRDVVEIENGNEVKIPNSFFQYYDKDFNLKQLTYFIEDYLSSEIKNYSIDVIEDLIINIRRGDFYTKEHRELYGFDQINYVKDALAKLNKHKISTIGIVSDDIDWCRKELSFLEDMGYELTFYPMNPIENLVILSRAKRLLVTNSTFSYWGAYLNEFFNSDATIIAPNFNSLKIEKGRMISASPGWKLIDVDTYYTPLTVIKIKVNQLNPKKLLPQGLKTKVKSLIKRGL